MPRPRPSSPGSAYLIQVPPIRLHQISPSLLGSSPYRSRPSYLDTEAAHTSVPPGGARDMPPQWGLGSGGGANDDRARSSLNRDPTGPTLPTRPLQGGRMGREGQAAARPRDCILNTC